MSIERIEEDKVDCVSIDFTYFSSQVNRGSFAVNGTSRIEAGFTYNRNIRSPSRHVIRIALHETV
jgi:hypothetical protein